MMCVSQQKNYIEGNFWKHKNRVRLKTKKNDSKNKFEKILVKRLKNCFPLQHTDLNQIFCLVFTHK